MQQTQDGFPDDKVGPVFATNDHETGKHISPPAPVGSGVEGYKIITFSGFTDFPNASMKVSPHTIQVLNGLVLGELAAAEICTEAIRLFPQSLANRIWEEVRGDHLESVDRLSELILREGGHPLAGTITNPYHLENRSMPRGEEEVIRVLMLREEGGLNGYAEALSDDKVPPQVKKVLREELMPPVQFHMIALDKLTASAI